MPTDRDEPINLDDLETGEVVQVYPREPGAPELTANPPTEFKPSW